MGVGALVEITEIQPRRRPRRVDVMGVHVSAVNPTLVVEQVRSWITQRKRAYLCVADVNSIVHAARDPRLGLILNQADLVVPDGMPLVWAGRYAGAADMARTSGPDLLPRLIAEGVASGWKHFLLGGAPGVAERLAAKFTAGYPGVEIVGTACPPFRALTPAEADGLVAVIEASRADILWVALGAPKQERWIHDYRPRLETPVMIGVGAAFNFAVGDVRRAPLWVQNLGLEWLFRLSQEPLRLWSRYAQAVPRFIFGVLTRRPTMAEDSRA